MAEVLWRGRIKEEIDETLKDFSYSIDIDSRLFREDIEGTIAHAKALEKAKVLKSDEKEKIINALFEIENEIENSGVPSDFEDIHTYIEKRLCEKVGEIGEKIHAGRSRNDQIVLDERLFLKKAAKQIVSSLEELQRAILKRAKEWLHVIFPGYTHMQHAQPVLLSHHLLAYHFMLKRDKERFLQFLSRIDVLPLGCCALAGTSIPLDREFLAKELGFSRISENSIDSVSDRDYIAEFIFFCSLIMAHLSRIAEDFIIWSSKEFGFIELPDRLSTGSSAMPQKKNPDLLELVRGKVGSIYGDLVNILVVLKGIPLSYNRDLQQDKESLFNSFDKTKSSLDIVKIFVEAVKINEKRMREEASDSFMLATDLSEYLVKKGLPFRKAYRLVGEIVKFCIESQRDLGELSLDELRRFSDLFSDDVFEIFDLEKSVDSKRTFGGTSKELVEKTIKDEERKLKA